MESIFSTISKDDVRNSPFPHVIKYPCLSEDYYRRLHDNFLAYDQVLGNQEVPNNFCLALPFVNSIGKADLSQEWQEFLKYHVSKNFFLDVVNVLGDKIRETYPQLEERVGKPLEDFTVGIRSDSDEIDVVIDCQFTYNTPVIKPSRVRAIHVDKPVRLFSGLLYMRKEDDLSTGSNLELFRFKDEPVLHNGVSVDDDDAEYCDTVEYKQNNLVFFINSLRSLHGVTERSVTNVPRQYINFAAEVNQPLFDIGRYQK